MWSCCIDRDIAILYKDTDTCDNTHTCIDARNYSHSQYYCHYWNSHHCRYCGHCHGRDHDDNHNDNNKHDDECSDDDANDWSAPRSPINELITKEMLQKKFGFAQVVVRPPGSEST